MLFGYFLAIQKVAYPALRFERNKNRMKRDAAKRESLRSRKTKAFQPRRDTEKGAAGLRPGYLKRWISPLSLRFFRRERRMGRPKSPTPPKSCSPTSILARVTTGWRPTWLPTIRGSMV